MKTPQQIQLELSRCVGDIALQNCIREIQADALLHASKIADDYDGKGLESHGYYNQLGDGRRTQTEIVKSIRSAAMPNDQALPQGRAKKGNNEH